MEWGKEKERRRFVIECCRKTLPQQNDDKVWIIMFVEQKDYGSKVIKFSFYQLNSL
jgi:hypothetical protein